MKKQSHWLVLVEDPFLAFLFSRFPSTLRAFLLGLNGFHHVILPFFFPSVPFASYLSSHFFPLPLICTMRAAIQVCTLLEEATVEPTPSSVSHSKLRFEEQGEVGKPK